MNRRLYFLFPDELHARHAVDKLLDEASVDAHHIHAIAAGEGGYARLPHPTLSQRSDMAGRLETWLWNGNLALFAVALAGFITALAEGYLGWAVMALLVMGATFYAGFFFTGSIPHVHLREFREALIRGEILLMIDVPRSRVMAVEEYIQHRYPEAVPGGASWSIDAFGL